MDTALRFISYVPSSDVVYPQRVIRVFPLQEINSQQEYTHGRLTVYLDIQFSEGLSLFIPFDDLIEEFVSKYYVEECTNVFSHTLTHLNFFRDTLIAQISSHGIPPDHVVVSGGICVVWGQVLYAASFGEISISLARGTQSAEILKTTSFQDLSVVSGFLEIDDVLVIRHPSYPLEEILAHPPNEDTEDEDQFFEQFVADHTEQGSFYMFKVAGISVPSYDEERIVMSSDSGESGEFIVEDELLPDEIATLHAEIEDDHVEQSLDVGDTIKPNNRFVALVRIFFHRIFWFTSKLTLPVIRFFTHKRLVLIGSMLLIVFFGFVMFGKDYENIWNSEVAVLEQKQSILPELEASFVAAQDSLERNPVRAQRLLMDLKNELASIPESLKSDPAVVALIEKVEESYAKATNSYAIDSVTSFFDLTTVSSQANGSRLAYFSNAYFISDIAQSVVYRVDSQTRAARALLGSDDLEGNLVDATADESRIYALGNRGVFSIGQIDSEVKKEFTAFEGWGKPVTLELFGSNVYVLDSEKSQIWKYVASSGTFGSPSNYLPSGNSYDLTESVDLVIDGFVWVGLKNGSILKFASGSAVSYSLETLTEPIESMKAINTSDSIPYIFVLDDVKGRVIAYSKETGGYLAQFTHELLQGSSDFSYNSENRMMTILKGSMLYTFVLPEFEK